MFRVSKAFSAPTGVPRLLAPRPSTKMGTVMLILLVPAYGERRLKLALMRGLAQVADVSMGNFFEAAVISKGFGNCDEPVKVRQGRHDAHKPCAPLLGCSGLL